MVRLFPRSNKIGGAIVRTLALLALLAPCVFFAQAADAAQQSSAAAPEASAQAARTLLILSPAPAARVAQSFVLVRWELTNPGASADTAPNYRVQLDDQEPVFTTDTEHTFNGLAPGEHTVRVQLVDANRLPIAGGSAEVRFQTVQPTTALPQSPTVASSPGPVVAAALEAQEAQRARRDHELPSAGGALPLISVIGFGVLLGGLASALKTR